MEVAFFWGGRGGVFFFKKIFYMFFFGVRRGWDVFFNCFFCVRWVGKV